MFEWCSKAVDGDAAKDYGGERLQAADTPAAPHDGKTSRALRGGSYDSSSDYCRLAYRDHYHPGYVNCDIGVRLVRCVLPHSGP